MLVDQSVLVCVFLFFNLTTFENLKLFGVVPLAEVVHANFVGQPSFVNHLVSFWTPPRPLAVTGGQSLKPANLPRLKAI